MAMVQLNILAVLVLHKSTRVIKLQRAVHTHTHTYMHALLYDGCGVKKFCGWWNVHFLPLMLYSVYARF